MNTDHTTPADTRDAHSRTSQAWPAAIVGIAAALAMSGGLVGCNAVDGAGEDLQEASQNVKQEIED